MALSDLYGVLPNKMLVSQWRECIAIKRQWEKGTLKHRLVSYVMDYNRVYFEVYVFAVVNEMKKRGIKYQEKYYDEIYLFCNDDENITGILHYPEHNNRYLKQCFYNLQEKWDRGILGDAEWIKIIKAFYKDGIIE